MNNQVIAFNKAQVSDKKLDLRAGDVVKVHRKIKEGEKERIQIFEGMIIAVKGGQSSSSMITVRKVSNGTGVEIVVPVHSPAIEKVELVKRAKVRRAKLYYIRDKAAKALRFKFKDAQGHLSEPEQEESFKDESAMAEKETPVSEASKEAAEPASANETKDASALSK